MAKALGNNPLLREETAFTEREVEAIKKATSDADLFVTASFRVRKTYLDKLKNYAYTYRITQKDIIDDILGEFLDSIDDRDLLTPMEQPIKRRKEK